MVEENGGERRFRAGRSSMRDRIIRQKKKVGWAAKKVPVVCGHAVVLFVVRKKPMFDPGFCVFPTHEGASGNHG